MVAYRYRVDRVYDGPVEVPDGPGVPRFHTLEVPPDAPEGFYVVMTNSGWTLVEGVAPVWPPPPTPEQIQAEIVNATQNRLDEFARTRNYDSILSACTYSTSKIPKFQVEGQYCVDKRDETWAALYQILNEVYLALRPMPTGYDDVKNDLPKLVWPN